MSNEVLSIREFAASVGVSWQQIATWKKKKQLPPKAFDADGKVILSVAEPIVVRLKANPTAGVPGVFKRRKAARAKRGAKTTSKASTPSSEASYEDFKAKYWRDGKNAADVLLLSDEASRAAFVAANRALQYAYAALKK
jgi:hypothetical protein